MIQVCYYTGCGIVYGEKEPLWDDEITYGLCPEHFIVTQRELQREIESFMRKNSRSLKQAHRPPHRKHP